MLNKTKLSKLNSATKLPLFYFNRLWRDTSGVSTIEFALVAPLFLILLSGIISIGFSIISLNRMEAQVSAAANFAMTSNTPTSEAEADDFLAVLSSIDIQSGLNNSNQGLDKISINFNNSHLGIFENGSFLVERQDGGLSDCYCPTKNEDQVAWGAAKVCASSCPDGTLAGKYLLYEATDSSPLSLLAQFRLVPDALYSNAFVPLNY